jgi:hypothetical protein
MSLNLDKAFHTRAFRLHSRGRRVCGIRNYHMCCLSQLHVAVQVEVEVTLRPTVSLLAPDSNVEPMTIFFLSDICGFLDIERPLRREDGSVIYSYSCF